MMDDYTLYINGMWLSLYTAEAREVTPELPKCPKQCTSRNSANGGTFERNSYTFGKQIQITLVYYI